MRRCNALRMLWLCREKCLLFVSTYPTQIGTRGTDTGRLSEMLHIMNSIGAEPTFQITGGIYSKVITRRGFLCGRSLGSGRFRDWLTKGNQGTPKDLDSAPDS